MAITYKVEGDNFTVRGTEEATLFSTAARVTGAALPHTAIPRFCDDMSGTYPGGLGGAAFIEGSNPHNPEIAAKVLEHVLDVMKLPNGTLLPKAALRENELLATLSNFKFNGHVPDGTPGSNTLHTGAEFTPGGTSRNA